jgi:hypothetical protein
MTTKEKAIEQLERISSRLASIGEKEDYTDVAIQALEQTRWIPCSERLPKENEYVDSVSKYYLVQNEYGDMLVARYKRDYWEEIYHIEPVTDKIVAWMPLPERYKERAKDEEIDRRIPL